MPPTLDPQLHREKRSFPIESIALSCVSLAIDWNRRTGVADTVVDWLTYGVNTHAERTVWRSARHSFVSLLFCIGARSYDRKVNMALARRGTRWITVDDRVYRWKVRHRPTYCQANGWTPLMFAVELAERPMSRLVVQLPIARPDNWLDLPGGVVTPALVAACIRDASANGWYPSRPGPAHIVRLSGPMRGGRRWSAAGPTRGGESYKITCP